MQPFEIYTLILCLIVFALLTTLSVVVITIIAKQTIKLIKLGAEDEKIIDEETKKKNTKVSKTFDYIVTGILSLIFIFFFCSSLYINCTQNTYFENTPTYKVVKTASMSTKNEKNKYLFENDLNDQIQAFDLIATYKLPAEKDLKLYDIVVYELDGVLLVHRIVQIEEPNASHPNERYFRCQGDAVTSPDRFPVKYEQMKGIYRGERIPAVGSFVLFMQSPAGWLCILLVAVAMVATPILEKKIAKTIEERLLVIKPTDIVEQDLSLSTQEDSQSTVQEMPLDNPVEELIDKVNQDILTQEPSQDLPLEEQPQVADTEEQSQLDNTDIDLQVEIAENPRQDIDEQEVDQNANQSEEISLPLEDDLSTTQPLNTSITQESEVEGQDCAQKEEV